MLFIFTPESKAALKKALEKQEAPCLPSVRSKLKGWWGEYHPRFPRWDVSVYAWDPLTEDRDKEYTLLFTALQVSYLEKRVLSRRLPSTSELPLVTTAERVW